jgi:large subunit ribosomal protein L25
MISLNAKPRTDVGRKTNSGRWQGLIPAVVYGPGVKNASISVDEKEFIKVFRKAGESSLVEITIEGGKEKRPVLINEIQKDRSVILLSTLIFIKLT